MALFFLEYDLRKEPTAKGYQALYDELALFSAVRVLKSSWSFTRVNTNATNLRDHFRKFIDANDGLCVTQVSDWATYNVESTPQRVSA